MAKQERFTVSRISGFTTELLWNFDVNPALLQSHSTRLEAKFENNWHWLNFTLWSTVPSPITGYAVDWWICPMQKVKTEIHVLLKSLQSIFITHFTLLITHHAFRNITGTISSHHTLRSFVQRNKQYAAEIWKQSLYAENVADVFRLHYARLFWICVGGKLRKGIHIVIVMPSFSKNFVFKKFFTNSSGLKSGSERHHFRDGLVCTEGLTSIG